jgi:hypothetical protein
LFRQHEDVGTGFAGVVVNCVASAAVRIDATWLR